MKAITHSRNTAQSLYDKKSLNDDVAFTRRERIPERKGSQVAQVRQVAREVLARQIAEVEKVGQVAGIAKVGQVAEISPGSKMGQVVEERGRTGSQGSQTGLVARYPR